MADEILTLGILVGVAALASLASHVLRLPPAATLIAAGLLVRPLVAPESPILQAVLVVSLAFLLFAGGAQFGHARLPQGAVSPVLFVGLGGTLLVGLLGFSAVSWLGWSPLAAAYAAAAAAFSSTLLVLQALRMRGEIREAHGRLLLAALLAQDAVALVLLTTLPAGADAPRAFFATLLLALLALGVLWLLRRPATWERLRDEETRVLATFALAFGFMLLARALDLPLIAGGFLAGLAVATFPARVQARPAIRIANEFFTPLFFISLGAFILLPTRPDLPALIALLLLVLIVKPLVLAFAAHVGGHGNRTSAQAGALGGQGSEFALMLAIAGLLSGHLDQAQFGVIGLVVATSMLASPFLRPSIERLLVHSLPTDRHPKVVPRRDHVVILGAGRSGRALVERLQNSDTPLVAVDTDPHALASLPPGTPIIRGDATDPRTHRAAHTHDARAIVCLVSQEGSTRELLAALTRPGRPVFARSEQVTTTPEGVVLLRPSAAVSDEIVKLLDALTMDAP